MELLALLLAQAEAAEAAEKTVGVLQKISQGGVPLICLAIAVVFGVACFLLYKQNQELQRERIGREAAYQEEQNKREAKAQAERAALEKDFREKIEALLREMIERGEDSQQVIAGNTTAVRDMTAGLKQLTTRIEYVERSMPRPSGPGAIPPGN